MRPLRILHATCPTYQLLGDELDGPRGRIYLIKQVLEGATPGPSTQLHLRCLTCRCCETTCPSGVQYGRHLVDRQVPRPAALRGKVARPAPAGQWSRSSHARKILLLDGCVQPSMAPNINAATARVLDALGVELVLAQKAGCCGAIRCHLNDQEGGLEDRRRNIDACWPLVGAEAIVMTSSACGATVKDYGHLLRHDAAYVDKAARISALAKDVSGVLCGFQDALARRADAGQAHKVAYHPPCAERIVSANVGCQSHLQAGTDRPVEHWIELLDRLLR